MKLGALVCLCLVTRCGITAAGGNGPGDITVAVEEGSDVVLLCSLSTKDNIEKMVFDWKKDDQEEKEVFFYQAGRHYNNGRGGQSERFKGRVFHFQDELKYGNASIKLQKTKMADSGNYTCTFPNKQTSHIRLVVDPDPERSVLKDRSGENIPGAAPKPSVTSLETTKDWSRLQCEVRGASPEPKVEWQDSSGNILPAEEPQVSERGGSYDVTLQVTVTKTDRYRCVATQETINHQTKAEIHVYIGGAAPEPSVIILEQTKDWSRLQCWVRGASPEPKVEWQDSSGNILPAEEPQVSERGGSYDVTLQVTVTKTDRYRCVATQETINHQIYTETHIYIAESSPGWVGIVVTFFVTLLVGGVIVGVLVAVLVAKRRITLHCNKALRGYSDHSSAFYSGEMEDDLKKWPQITSTSTRKALRQINEEKRRNSLDDPSQQLQVQQH